MKARPNAITTEAVRGAYKTAKEQWQPPNAADCEAIANTLFMYQSAKAQTDTMRMLKFDAAGRRRVARAENVRKAIATLLLDLPELVEHLQGRLSGTPEHAQSLSDLLDATRKAATLWPYLNGTIRKFDPRTDWARTADCIVGQIMRAWRRANPGRKIGKPLSPDQPATKLLAVLLGMAGHGNISPDQIAQHFNRDKIGFVLLDAAGNS